MTDDHNSEPRLPGAQLGAYGLSIDGLPDADEWMQVVPTDSPVLRVDVVPADGEESHDRPTTLAPDAADLRLVGGGRLRMRRGTDRAEYSFLRRPTPDELVHPYLAPAAALAQLWAGCEALHAGAFATGAGAVLLLAKKEGGKSTTLSALAGRHGLPVITDDLAVIADGAIFAGPRCIDLRRSATLGRQARDDARAVRGDGRVRVRLPPVPAAVTIQAVAWLEWDSKVIVDPVSPRHRLPGLLPQRMYRALVPADGVELLNLAALPAVRLGRPRGEAGLRDACAALADYFA